jgi:hypothetical protein
MYKTIILIAAIIPWCFGCVGAVGGTPQRAYDSNNIASMTVAANAPKKLGSNGLVFNPTEIDVSALPSLQDLPVPATLKNQRKAHEYTGIIKNKTRYKISIPSKNSDATLIIPPHSWITYTIWVKHENVTAYHRGNPYYCLNILAHPGEYPFICKKYDFMVEILPREPAIRHWPSKLKRRIRRG